MQNVKYICHIVKHANLIKMEKQPHQQPQLRLLPHYFKFVGRVILLLGLALISITYKEDFGKYNNIRAKVLLGTILIGFLLYSFAKEKIEDELMILIRLQSMANAFILTILYTLLLPIFGFIISGRNIDVEGLHVILISLLTYSFIYEFKRKRM